MSSGTRYDPGSVRKLLAGLTSKLITGGMRVENFAESYQRIANLGMSPRQQMLNRLHSWYRCEQYAARRSDWNGREVVDPIEHEAIAHSAVIPPGFNSFEDLPIKFRRPTAPYALVKVVVDRFTGLLFSERHHPQVRAEGDPDTEDFLQAVVREGRLWPQMIMARTYGGSMGTVAVGFQIVDGVIEFEVHDPRWCKPKFLDRSKLILSELEKRYMFPVDELDRETGKYVTNWYWYRRILTDSYDVLYEQAPVGDGTEPAWVEKKVVDHGLGFCPVVWVQNTPVQDDIDGDPDCLGGYDLVETIDALLAQANKGIISNCDPTVVVCTDASLDSVKKGSDNALKLPADGSANYMEISGSGPDAALNLAEKFRKGFLEVVQCVLEHPDVGNRTATEIERVYSAMIAKADVMREQYGEKAIIPLLEMVVKAVRKVTAESVHEETGAVVRGSVRLPPKLVVNQDGEVVHEERAPGPAGTVKLQWPKYFEPMLTDVELATRSAIAAKAGKLIDKEHAVKYVAEYYGIKDVPAMMARIEREQEQEQDALAAQALGMLRSPGAPSGGER